MSMNLGLNLALGSTRAAGGFNPAAALFGAGEQGYWLDPSDFSTMFQDAAGTTPVTAVGQSVRRILDKSGRGNTFTQANTANAPILQQDASGRYFLLFDGTDDWLQSAATINPGAVDKVQVFAGVRKLSTSLGIIMEASADSANNNGAFSLFTQNATIYQYSFGSRGSITSSALTNDPSFAAPVTTVLTGTADISGNVARLRANGSQVGQATSGQGTGNYLTHTHFIGRRNGTSLPFNGRIYQLITRFGANLSADQITQTEAFVTSRTVSSVPAITRLKTLLDGQSDASIHDFTQATLVGGTTFTATDLSTNGNSFTQATAANRPGISGTLGATFDGNDQISRPCAGGTYSVALAMTKGVSTDGGVLTNQAAAFVLRYLSGSPTAVSGLTVNGAAITTLGAFFTALDGAGERIVAFNGASFAAATALAIGRTSGGLLGSVRRIVVIPEAQVTGTNLTNARELAAEWVAL